MKTLPLAALLLISATPYAPPVASGVCQLDDRELAMQMIVCPDTKTYVDVQWCTARGWEFRWADGGWRL